MGERFYIYACKSKAKRPPPPPPPIWSEDLRLATPPPPLWMIELAEQVGMIPPGELGALPRGVIVGSAVVERVEEVRGQKSEVREEDSPLTSDLRPPTSIFKWHLSDVRRAKTLRKPRRHPQPGWFRPF